MKPLVNYLKESRAELLRVNWPNRQQLIRLTVAVLLFSAFFGILIGILDLGFSEALQRLILKG